MKRILTIQDISCVGKCSLTVALPIISAMGIEVSVIPTAVLSMHTAFPEFTFRDLTEDIRPIVDLFEKTGIQFDAIYTGYLGSIEQIEIVRDIIRRFRGEGTKVVVDPVMADFGELYKGFDPSYVKEMSVLCREADVILPNMTEASLLLGIPYHKPKDREDVESIVKNLTGLGPEAAILTGTSFGSEELGAALFNRASDEFYYHAGVWYRENFHGTGDVFASVFTGGLVRGLPVKEAMALAVDFTDETVRLTVENPEARWYGVDFETAIPYLVKKVLAIKTNLC